jgi:hypothetical protein
MSDYSEVARDSGIGGHGPEVPPSNRPFKYFTKRQFGGEGRQPVMSQS